MIIKNYHEDEDDDWLYQFSVFYMPSTIDHILG